MKPENPYRSKTSAATTTACKDWNIKANNLVAKGAKKEQIRRRLVAHCDEK